MEKAFRTRFETANIVYRYFRTGPDIFPILFGFDALRLRISSHGISCTNIQLLEMLNEIFTFEIFEFSTDGHRWISLGCQHAKKNSKLTYILLLGFPYKVPEILSQNRENQKIQYGTFRGFGPIVNEKPNFPPQKFPIKTV